MTMGLLSSTREGYKLVARERAVAMKVDMAGTKRFGMKVDTARKRAVGMKVDTARKRAVGTDAEDVARKRIRGHFMKETDQTVR